VHTFSHLSASIVLSRKRASEGLFPAIDPLQSNSKMATPGIVGERHYGLAQKIRRTLAQYAELKDIIAMLGLEQLSPEDRNVVARARRLERFLTQPLRPAASPAAAHLPPSVTLWRLPRPSAPRRDQVDRGEQLRIIYWGHPPTHCHNVSFPIQRKPNHHGILNRDLVFRRAIVF